MAKAASWTVSHTRLRAFSAAPCPREGEGPGGRELPAGSGGPVSVIHSTDAVWSQESGAISPENRHGPPEPACPRLIPPLLQAQREATSGPRDRHLPGPRVPLVRPGSQPTSLQVEVVCSGFGTRLGSAEGSTHGMSPSWAPAKCPAKRRQGQQAWHSAFPGLASVPHTGAPW